MRIKAIWLILTSRNFGLFTESTFVGNSVPSRQLYNALVKEIKARNE